jgi:MFS family permease
MAPGLLDVAIKYEITNPTVLALTLSIFLLSYAIGPLVMAPLSEMYGRAWVRFFVFTSTRSPQHLQGAPLSQPFLPGIQCWLRVITKHRNFYYFPISR